MLRSFVRLMVVVLLLTSPTTLIAQIVPIRTVPVASGDQFLTLPSANLGMGGVRLAIDDSIADPWSNPAKGVFLTESAFLSSPVFYGISGGGGSGKTFPLAGLFRGGEWFGGASLALQQIDNSRNGDQIWLDPFVRWEGPARRLSDASSRNLYAAGFLGRRLGRGPWSLGLAASTAHLDALDGVDLLYAGADRIEQSGSLGDVRVGLYRVGAKDRLSVTVAHNRVSMTHDVSYLDFVWDQNPENPPVVQGRLEVNEDQTRSWGAEIAWDHDLAAPGWRIGTSATVNRKSHPKIPNYSIQNIPRDPGLTWAYEAGFGLARVKGPTTFGLDVVIQPIWSETWQEADVQTSTATGGIIAIGDKTIENEFFFTNILLRAGLSHQLDDFGLQLGLEVRSYDYTLEQTDHVAASFRDQDETWMEWTPSFGATFRFSDLELRYGGRLTTGTGQPGVSRNFDDAVASAFESTADFIIAPEAPLTLQDATVMTHQFSVRIPIR